jgi:NAD(P)-dependent dehydrogenase (short-subunit alcohol dehydrogenase family)
MDADGVRERSRRNCSTLRQPGHRPEDATAHAVAPEAIAGLIAFLVSDAAAPVSRAILPADGALAYMRPGITRPGAGWPAPAGERHC